MPAMLALFILPLSLNPDGFIGKKCLFRHEVKWLARLRCICSRAGETQANYRFEQRT